MTKIINLGTSAFYELQEATKKAKISFDGFETAISKAFTKQAKKEWSLCLHQTEKSARAWFCIAHAPTKHGQAP